MHTVCTSEITKSMRLSEKATDAVGVQWQSCCTVGVIGAWPSASWPTTWTFSDWNDPWPSFETQVHAQRISCPAFYSLMNVVITGQWILHDVLVTFIVDLVTYLFELLVYFSAFIWSAHFLLLWFFFFLQEGWVLVPLLLHYSFRGRNSGSPREIWSDYQRWWQQ